METLTKTTIKKKVITNVCDWDRLVMVVKDSYHLTVVFERELMEL